MCAPQGKSSPQELEIGATVKILRNRPLRILPLIQFLYYFVFFVNMYLFLKTKMTYVLYYLSLEPCEAYKSVLFIHSVSIHIDDSN